MGTSNYMAPEIWQMQLVDIRADLYALGCTFFKLLTGRVPYPTNELGLAAKSRLIAHLLCLPYENLL